MGIKTTNNGRAALAALGFDVPTNTSNKLAQTVADALIAARQSVQASKAAGQVERSTVLDLQAKLYAAIEERDAAIASANHGIDANEVKDLQAEVIRLTAARDTLRVIVDALIERLADQ